MAYGRLDVLFPDGNFRSFPLVNQTESVGRSPGNTIKLDAETISRYHISITRHPDSVELADMDSQNGTYVDGVKVPNGETIELRGGEEILIGELRIIYHVMDEMPTQPMNVMEDTTEVIRESDAPFHVSLQPPPISIPPGAHASAELTIANLTDEQSYYTVAVSGVPKNWVRLDRPRVLLEPHESGQVVINVRPTRQPETTPGDYSVTVTVHEEGHGDHIVEASTRIHILPYGGFGMALEQDTIDARERFRLHLHNQGSADLPLTIGPSQRTSNVALEFVSSPQVTLGPGQRLVIQGHARPKESSLFGSSKPYPFDIAIRSQQPNQFLAVVQGNVVQRATFAGWVPYAIGASVLGFVLFLVLLFAFAAAPTPTIDTFSVEPLSVPRGAPFAIEWQGEDIRDLTLYVDETPVAELTPENGTYSLDSTFVSENAVLRLEAGAGRRMANPVEQRVQVYEPMQSVQFDVTPPLLVQNVVETLSINWEITNADFVQIGGLDPFAMNDFSESARYDATDSIEGIPGIAQTNLTIELYAEDPLGNTFNDTITVESVPAQCTPITETLLLRDGPTLLNQQISTLQGQNPVTIVGQDSSGQWLAVELGPDLTGWGELENFECANTFNPADLRQIINVIPPASPTPTPSVTPLPTPTPTLGPIVTQQADELGTEGTRTDDTSSE